MNKRSISLYFVLLTAIINIFAFADFPKSHAKYIKTENEAISYETSIKKLKLSTGEGSDYTTKDNVSLLSSSVKDHAVFTVKFNRSNSMYIDQNGIYSDKLDTYRFTVKDNKNACYVRNNSVSSQNGSIIYNSSKEFTVTYNNSLDDTVYLILECSVVDDPSIDNATDNIYVSFDILESITNYNNVSEEEFTYIEYGYPLVLNDFYSAVYTWHPEENPDFKYKYQSALEALETKYPEYKETTIMNELVEYFDTVFESSKENDELFISNKDNLKGFRYDETLENPYVFEDNYAGYALTSLRYEKFEDKTKYQFYFSDVSNLNIETKKAIFEEYFNAYASSTISTEENKNKITNYINSYMEDSSDLLGGFAKMFEGAIFGINTTKENDLLTLSFTDAILTVIANEDLDEALFNSADTVTLANKSEGEELWSTFIIKLGKLEESIVNDVWDYFNSLTNENDPSHIREYIIINNNLHSNTTIETIFFLVPNTNVFTNVYSDVNNTYVKLTKLEHNKRILLASAKGSTLKNGTLTDAINYIDIVLDNNIKITSWPSAYDTQVDSEGVTHRYYIVNDITYDMFTKDDINYVSYTTK